MIGLVWALCIVVVLLSGWCCVLQYEIKNIYDLMDRMIDVDKDIVKLIDRKFSRD